MRFVPTFLTTSGRLPAATMLALLLGAAPGHAALTYTSLDREIVVGAPPGAASATSAAAGHFEESLQQISRSFLAEAQQASDVDAFAFGGRGSARMDTSLQTQGDFATRSAMEIVFEIDAPHAFDASLQLAGSDSGDFAGGARTSLQQIIGTTITGLFSFDDSDGDETLSLTLPAGRYRFAIAADALPGFANATGTADGSFDFRAVLTPLDAPPGLPEPGTLALAAAAAVLASGRRRAGRSQA